MEDKNITVISDKPNEANTSLSGSSMTKTGRLAWNCLKRRRDLSKN